jgi:hypothetical protein
MKSYKLNLLAVSIASAILVTGCGGGGGGSPTTVTPPVVTAPAPTIALSFASPKATVGTPVVLTWTSTNATSCTGSDGLSGSLLTGNSTTITPTVGGVAKYTVSCTGAGGSTSKSADLITPIPVQKTSYLNFKTVNLPAQIAPISSTFVANEAVTSGIAYGDFFQDGTISMVAATNVFNGSGTFGSTDAGRIYFFHTDGKGGWIDQTNKILGANDRTGCLSPRKVIVADFNGDGKPDSFIVCHGIDGDVKPGFSQGEHPRYILSQSDGTYKNIDAGFNCYCHGAAAADFNSDGFADIVVASPPVLGRVVYLKNNKDGTFTDSPSLIPASTFNKSIWSMEFVDVNSDGKFDLAMYGSEHGNGTPGGTTWDWQPTFFINSGTNIFSDTMQQVKAPFSLNGDALDIIVGNGKIAFTRSDNNPTKKYQVQILSFPSMTQLSVTDIGALDSPWFNLYNGNIVGMWVYNNYSISF